MCKLNDSSGPNDKEHDKVSWHQQKEKRKHNKAYEMQQEQIQEGRL